MIFVERSVSKLPRKARKDNKQMQKERKNNGREKINGERYKNVQ